jgi:hypothetical protein
MILSPSRHFIGPTFVVLVCLIAPTARAVVVWNEGIDGDLSNSGAAPTALALSFGSNTLTATSIGGTGIDREYVAFSMPSGSQLSQVVLTAYASADALAFIGVQSGSTFTEPPTGTNPGNLLGYSHFGPGALGTGVDYLAAIGTGFGSQGFTPPLPGGNYTFWIQQTSSSSSATYTWDFVVAPEPGAIALLCAGALALPLVRRRR